MAKGIFLVRQGSPEESFELREFPDLIPEKGYIRISVEAFGLNFAEVLARMGLYPEAPRLPAILGYEVVGRVDAVGPNVSRFKVGQRVLAFTLFGGYANQTVASELLAVEIPDTLDAATATALGTQYCTAYYAADEMVRLHAGDHVLIHAAAGGVGIALIQLLKHKGCVIFATAGSEEKVAFLKGLGVDHCINYRRKDFAAEIKKIQSKQYDSKRLDVVFDSLGGETTRKSRKLLGRGGRLVSYGIANMAKSGGRLVKTLNAVKTVAEFGLLSPLKLLARSQGYIGINMLVIGKSRPDIMSRCLKNVADLAARGVLKPHLGKAFSSDQIAEAHRLLESRDSIGKIAIRWPLTESRAKHRSRTEISHSPEAPPVADRSRE